MFFDTSFNASRYNTIFYLLNKFKKDDEVILCHNRQKYLYKITTHKVLSPDKSEDYLKTLKGNI